MAGVSDGLLVVTLISYVAAMVAHAVHLTVRTPVGGALRSQVPAAVPVAGPVALTGQQRRDVVVRWTGPATTLITTVGVVAHAATVLTRAAAADRVPLGNMYEFILTAGLVGAVAWLAILLRRPSARGLGLFVTLALVILLGAAGRLHVRAEPLVPALASPWLRIHVGAAVVATGLLLVGFVTTVLYLGRLRHDAAAGSARRTSFTIGQVPDPAALDRLALRLHQVAFPIWTFAIVAGAIWAEAAWGRYWGWDPKETWAFVSWVLYACYLHARSTAGWRGRRAALVAVTAWATMMVNVFVVNIAFSGLHSYAGL